VEVSEEVRASLAAAKTRADDLQRSQQQTRVKVRDDAKARAREKLTQLAERLRLIKSLYGANPKELARQIAHLVKELKAELKTYAEAAKANGEYVSASSPAPGAESAGPVDTAAQADPAAAQKASPHESAEREARIAGAHADLDFIKQVRGLLKIVRQTLTEARIKDGAALVEPRNRASPFRDADEALKEVDEAIEDIEKAAKADLPIPGMQVSELA
jgi:hypothetical protein